MKQFIKEALRKKLADKPRQEWFKAYQGRYMFDIDLAHDLIKNNKVKYEIKKFGPQFLSKVSYGHFSYTNPEKLKKLENEIDYSRPLGLLVNFRNPDTKQTEWMLIDGNHRVTVTAKLGNEGLLYVISDPNEVDKFLKVDEKIPHELFPDLDKM